MNQYDRAKELYNQGKSLRNIADQLGIDRKKLSKKFKEDGIMIRDPYKNNTGKAKRFKEVDESIFENIDTEEKAYWLGFIYADGYVNNRQIELTLKESDYEHIKKFKSFMHSEHKISYKKSVKAYRITICSPKIANDLTRLGCFQCKSLTLKFPTEEQVPKHLIHHFMRGYYDGDGSITINLEKKCYLISVLGTSEFLDEYEKNILRAIGRDKPNKRFHNGQALGIQYGGRLQVEKICDFLYRDATIYLDRKYNKFAVLRQGCKKSQDD